MKIKITLTDKELDLLIRLLDEEIDDMMYFNYSTAGTKDNISKLESKLKIYRNVGEVFLSRKNTNDGDKYED